MKKVFIFALVLLNLFAFHSFADRPKPGDIIDLSFIAGCSAYGSGCKGEIIIIKPA